MPDNYLENSNKNKAQEKLERLRNKLKKGTKGFFQHLMPYIFVNGFLFFINMTTSPVYPWFLYPLGGWGIGLISHLFITQINKKQSKELEKIPSDINEEQLHLIKKIFSIETGLYGHIGPFISTNAFLMMIYAITTFGGFPWFLFPLFGWGFGLFMHVITAVPNLIELKKKLKETDLDFSEESSFIRTKNKDKITSIENINDINFSPKDEENKKNYSQALRIKNSLIKQVVSNPYIKQKIDFDIEQNILNYIDHLKQLILRDEEISLILETISHEDINKQIENLSKKYEQTNHEDLKNEYKKSIEKYNRHKNSYEELMTQKEMIKLKISSSMMSLKQLELDLANMKEIITTEDNYSLRIFEEQSEDLNRYVNSLKSSYQILKRELE